MPIPSPNLDDRTFQQLLDEAKLIVQQKSPGWTDLSPSDPGTVLLEAFAHLTEVLIYRLNLLPDKAFHEFLRLIGVEVRPPTAAGVALTFSRPQAGPTPVEVPGGTQVTLAQPPAGGPGPVFVTLAAATIPAGAQQVTGVLALCCEVVEAELAGVGTGRPGLSVSVQRPPIVGPTADGRELIVGVESAQDPAGDRLPAIEVGGKQYQVWREVSDFGTTAPGDFVYVCDRLAGRVTFAPAVMLAGGGDPVPLGAAPGAGREIRLWYRRGGGPEGNVPAGSLSVLRSPIPGITVFNPGAATGGSAAEPLDNALLRGPQEMLALKRVVTARDYEFFAEQSAFVCRAYALTRSAVWTFAVPGTVEVILVPQLSDSERAGRVTADVLHQHETPNARDQIQTTLDDRRTLGTACLVSWARYKTVTVHARLGVRREENADAVKQRVLDRLYQVVSPLPRPDNPGSGWPFGQSLRASEVYYLAQLEPGVRWVQGVQLSVDAAPSQDVRALTTDAHQPDTWYATSGASLFRSLNHGQGWEPAGTFSGEQANLVATHPDQPGLLALSTLTTDGGSRIRLSVDCGESWEAAVQTLAFRVNDLTWTGRDGSPTLLLATDQGLYELGIAAGATPVQVLVDPAQQQLAFFAVTAVREVRGEDTVAVATQNSGGVYLSNQGGRTRTFRSIGLQGQDVRVLEVQVVGPRSVLWAGVAVEAVDDPGKGCQSWELRGADNPPEGWQTHAGSWKAGSCRGLAFLGSTVLAATHHGGVLVLDPTQAQGGTDWRSSQLTSGLPLRDRENFLFQPVVAIAAARDGSLAMAGTAQGVFLTADTGTTFVTCSQVVFSDEVTLPPTWLFVSGQHDVTTVEADAGV